MSDATEKLLDEILKDYQTPEQILGENVILKQLTKRLAERALQSKALARLDHVKSHLHKDWIETNKVDFWNEKLSNIDNFEWGFIKLRSYCILRILTAWFEFKDIAAVRNYAFNYAKLHHITTQPPYEDWGQEYAYEKRTFEGLWILISNYQPLIESYANLDKIFGKAADNPKSEQ